MGYLTDGLTFNTLRQANEKRLPLFPGRSQTWDHSKWMQALVGELGEAANLLKKLDRGDFALDEGRERIAEELADTAIYLDLICTYLGIDLGPAIMKKWNADCRKHGIPLRIDAEDWHWTQDDPSPRECDAKLPNQ